ncbi:MAG: hypothetical protein KDK45_13330, partial [Leptospiraceae bacterium]|nr:hypothetical protein [Leptospiraceae bacterium]
MDFINELIIANIALYFLIIALLVSNYKERQGWYLLGIVSILASFSILGLSFLTSGKLLVYFPFLVFPIYFLLGPLVFFYTRSILYFREFHLHKDKKVFIPVILMFLIHLFMYFLFEELRDPLSIKKQVKVVRIYTYALSFLNGCYNLSFYSLSFKWIKKYQFHYDKLLPLIRFHIFYLKIIISTLSVWALLAIGISILDMWKRTPLFPISSPGAGITLFLSYILVFYYIKKPFIPSSEKKSQAKYAKQSLSPEKRTSYLKKLEIYLEKEKLFLDENLTLDILAKQLDISPYHLTMVINIEKQMNFFKYINDWRIREAKKLLENPENKN